MIIEQEVKRSSVQASTKVFRPTIQAWKGVPMIRVHSFRATIREVLQYIDSLDFVKIGIVGNQSTGKTTLAEAICHLIHKLAPVPFGVKLFNKNNLLNFRETLKTLTATNWILVFDDVSFLGANATKKQIEIIKQAVTEIRHLPGGKDVKIIVIMNYHYTLGLDKYLRQADFFYFTTVGSSEIDNMEKLAGGKNMEKVKQFQRLFTNAVSKKRFSFKLKTGITFSYGYRMPFIPLLFFNNNTLRFVVSPTRYWIDKFCTICDQAHTETLVNTLNVDEINKEGKAKFGIGTYLAALRLNLFIHGINVYSSKISRCSKWINLQFQNQSVKLTDLAAAEGLTITKTKLHKHVNEITSTELKPTEVAK